MLTKRQGHGFGADLMRTVSTGAWLYPEIHNAIYGR